MTLRQALRILAEHAYIVENASHVFEDFGIGVGAPLGADQGIPCGGDRKAVVAMRMDGGKPKTRFAIKRRGRKRRRK